MAQAMAADLCCCEPGSPGLRAKAHEDWLLSSTLEPIYEALNGAEFNALLKAFVEDRWTAFETVWPDGSHPLIWTLYHADFKRMFDMQLEATLSELGLSVGAFGRFVGHLGEVRASLGESAENLDGLLRTMTASEDYSHFLHVMFSEVRRRQEAGLLPLASAASSPPSREIQVSVPAGSGPGHSMSVMHDGLRYELPVPDGCWPGMAFRASIVQPAAALARGAGNLCSGYPAPQLSAGDGMP